MQFSWSMLKVFTRASKRSWNSSKFKTSAKLAQTPYRLRRKISLGKTREMSSEKAADIYVRKESKVGSKPTWLRKFIMIIKTFVNASRRSVRSFTLNWSQNGRNRRMTIIRRKRRQFLISSKLKELPNLKQIDIKLNLMAKKPKRTKADLETRDTLPFKNRGETEHHRGYVRLLHQEESYLWKYDSEVADQASSMFFSFQLHIQKYRVKDHQIVYLQIHYNWEVYWQDN